MTVDEFIRKLKENKGSAGSSVVEGRRISKTITDQEVFMEYIKFWV